MSYLVQTTRVSWYINVNISWWWCWWWQCTNNGATIISVNVYVNNKQSSDNVTKHGKEAHRHIHLLWKQLSNGISFLDKFGLDWVGWWQFSLGIQIRRSTSSNLRIYRGSSIMLLWGLTNWLDRNHLRCHSLIPAHVQSSPQFANQRDYNL